MGPLIKFAIVLGGLWMVSEIGAPRRQYRAKHIEPVEWELQEWQARVASLREEEEDATWSAGLFTRDLEAEEARWKRIKREGHNEQAPIKARMDEASARLRKVKADLNDWFAEANGTVLGNGGQELRQSSFWGQLGIEQTKDQRDSLKEERDALGRELDVLHRRHQAIFHAKIEPAKDGLEEIEEARIRLEELQEERQTPAQLLRQASLLRTQIAAAEAEIARLQARIRELERAF